MWTEPSREAFFDDATPPPPLISEPKITEAATFLSDSDLKSDKMLGGLGGEWVGCDGSEDGDK